MAGEQATGFSCEGTLVGLVSEHINCGTIKVSVLERTLQRHLVYNATTRGVDENRVGLHQIDLRAADHISRVRSEGYVQGYDVCFPEDLVQTNPLDVCSLK